MMRPGWRTFGPALAVVFVAAAAGCRESPTAAGSGTAGPPGAADAANLLSRLESSPKAAAPEPDGVVALAPGPPAAEEPAGGALPASPPPGSAGQPPGAADLLPYREAEAEKTAETTEDEDRAGSTVAKGTGSHRARPTASFSDRTLEPRDDGEAPGPLPGPPGGGAGLGEVQTTVRETADIARPSCEEPLPPSPSVSPGTVAAPTVPAPATVQTAGAAADGSGRVPATGSGSGLPAFTVRSVLRRREAALQRCYDDLLLRAPGTGSGSLSVRMRIRTTGEVEGVERVGGTLEDAEFERCVLEQVRRVGFPAADAPTVFTHSFQFAPSGGAAPFAE